MEIKTMEKRTTKKMLPERYEDLVKKLRKEHDKLCKGMFEFLDAQGGWIEFAYRFFKDDPVMTIRLNHGEICELPMGIVKHLNNTKKKVRKISPMLTERGLPSTYEVFSRLRFTPCDVL